RVGVMLSEGVLSTHLDEVCAVGKEPVEAPSECGVLRCLCRGRRLARHMYGGARQRGAGAVVSDLPDNKSASRWLAGHRADQGLVDLPPALLAGAIPVEYKPHLHSCLAGGLR